METAVEVNLIKIVSIGFGFVLIFIVGFVLLLIKFKQHIIAEQKSMRLAKINFDRQLNEATVKAEEQERLSIAMDLHDEIGGLLLVCKLNLLNAKALSNAPHEQVEILEETIMLIEKTADAIRQISNRVLPPSLVKMGLEVALTEFIHSVNLTKRLDIDFHADIPVNRLNLDAELNVYRIVKECINNILKHGNASTLELDIIHDDVHLNLSFHYAGIGLNNKDVTRLLVQKNGNGLKSIQSRIQQLNASIDYQVSADKLNHIRIKIPLHEFQH